MITKPTHSEIIESVRADLREIVMHEVTSDRARSALRLADQLLGEQAAAGTADGAHRAR